MALTLPIKPVVKPSTLVGQSNGKLATTLLTLIGVGNAMMELTAARAFRALFFHARQSGFVIKEVGDYRTFQEQLNLFLRDYKPVSYDVWRNTPSAHRKLWTLAPSYGYSSQYWIKKDFSTSTKATPGDSNHGWGLALDIAEEYDGDPDPDGIRDVFVQWLIDWADFFGICAELQSEKWHWRYYKGDAIPQAVLDYEAGNPPPPDPPTGGEYQVNVIRETVQLGSTGLWVERLQAVLNSVWNQDVGPTDGQFGSRTQTGVKNAQAWANGKGWANPPLTVDGICGPKTWAVIENYPNPKNP